LRIRAAENPVISPPRAFLQSSQLAGDLGEARLPFRWNRC
jgi:hypothetical protein